MLDDLDRYELWFLEVVVELRYPTWMLTSPEIELHLNRSGHGLDLDGVAHVLGRLHRRGLIAYSTHEGLDGETDLYYELTSLGGAAWEQHARPDWNRYLSRSFGERAEVIGTDRGRVADYLASPWPFERAIAGTETWDVLEPWKATYWKRLELGHRVRFDYRRQEPKGGEERTAWLNDVNRWFTCVAL
jgi:hypothetical protein